MWEWKWERGDVVREREEKRKERRKKDKPTVQENKTGQAAGGDGARNEEAAGFTVCQPCDLETVTSPLCPSFCTKETEMALLLSWVVRMLRASETPVFQGTVRVAKANCPVVIAPLVGFGMGG